VLKRMSAIDQNNAEKDIIFVVGSRDRFESLTLVSHRISLYLH
jgi:hypothetical protein